MNDYTYYKWDVNDAVYRMHRMYNGRMKVEKYINGSWENLPTAFTTFFYNNCTRIDSEEDLILELL